jgi:hypothetical protein
VPYDNGDGDTGTEDLCSYTIPVGYHDGTTRVAPEAYIINHTNLESAKTYKAEDGKVISQVKVSAIPNEYSNIEGTTAKASDVLRGKTFYSEANGHRTQGSGTITTFSAVSENVNESRKRVKISKGYYEADGYVTFDDSAIIAALKTI